MNLRLYFLFLSCLSSAYCDKNTPSGINSIKNADNKPDKSNEFLHEIKEDLRRNNDDYVEATRIITTNPPHNISNNLKFHYKKEHSNLIKDLQRRAYDSLSDDDNATDYKETDTIAHTIKRFSKVTQAATLKTELDIKDINKLKMRFANSDLLKQFAKNKAMAISSTMSDNLNVRMKAREAEKENVLPNPDQLDMAPAKGGRIHMLRIKGRLCQRNVLIPEGPKYDSNGNVYLPAFSSAPKHNNFEMTRSPKIILPRCCNCCKKSVLGCE